VLFGRSDEQFWTMTPGQLGVLIRQHNKTQEPAETTSEAQGPRQGTAADLARLAAMPLT